jgi:hypothetical protein
MEQGRHLDVNKSVQRFLSQFESLSRLPFISDSEMGQLFGEEVNLGLAELNCLNHQKQFCRDCKERCCRLVDCELYQDTLTRCPIHSFRPVLCRIHYCHKFALEQPFLVKELGDIFLESLVSAQSLDAGRTRLLDSPPLRQFAPDLIADISKQTAFLAANKDLEAEISGAIDSKLEKYRTNMAG